MMGRASRGIPASSKGMGHHIMSYRAKMIGGTLEIQSRALRMEPWSHAYFRS